MRQQISCCLLIGILLRIQQSSGILNRRRQVNRAAAANPNVERHYLNAKRPLWILDDSVQHQDFERVSYSSTTRPITHYANNRQHYDLPRRIALPSHYKYPLNVNRARNMRRTELLTTQKPSMPQFDSFPGQDNADPVPIFIYNGPKGELLVNTMLSTRKYPMQEPIPGEILYPPTTPIFRPKPIVQRYRIKDQEHSTPLNLTLLPFYAHEAIDPRSISNFDDMSQITTTQSIFYAAPATAAASTPPRPAFPPTSSSRKSKHNKLGKWQKYKVFHSKDEVQWRPSVNLEMPHTTTPFPMALASPPQRNHRYNEVYGSSFTTSKPLSHYKSMRDKEGNFRIIYIDESLEQPVTVDATVKEPLHSSRYVASQDIFAFPVFTLGKLLTPERTAEDDDDDDMRDASETLSKVKVVDKLEQQNASNTLFVLNSRYKGHFKDLSNYRYSSKYIQNPIKSIAAYDITTK